MRVTMLGCGASVGVPFLGNNWGACDPTNPRNRRRRCSIVVEKDGFVLLVDTSPDLREQLNDAGISRIDALLYTHAHADHTNGIDDLRPLYWFEKRTIPCYSDRTTLDALSRRFDYMFERVPESAPHHVPLLDAQEIGEGRVSIGPFTIDVRRQDHGVSGESLGFVFDGRFGYSTDVAVLSDAELADLRGLELWIVDCLRREKATAHSTLEQTLEWVTKAEPKRAVLTHMHASLDYAETLAACPPTVEPGYDGLVVEL